MADARVELMKSVKSDMVFERVEDDNRDDTSVRGDGDVAAGGRPQGAPLAPAFSRDLLGDMERATTQWFEVGESYCDAAVQTDNSNEDMTRDTNTDSNGPGLRAAIGIQTDGFRRPRRGRVNGRAVQTEMNQFRNELAVMTDNGHKDMEKDKDKNEDEDKGTYEQDTDRFLWLRRWRRRTGAHMEMMAMQLLLMDGDVKTDGEDLFDNRDEYEFYVQEIFFSIFEDDAWKMTGTIPLPD